MEFNEIVKARYATKMFNGNMIPPTKIDELLEIIRMSASSFGLQPYKIKVVSDKQMKDALTPATFNQPQVSNCSHLLVFCIDTNVNAKIAKYEKMLIENGTTEDKAKEFSAMLRNNMQSMTAEWAARQVYIAVGNAINGAKSLGFDSCPLEGFNPIEYVKLLSLPPNLVPVVLVAVGYAADTPRPKIRYSKEELFF
jgi:nitroreductase